MTTGTRGSNAKLNRDMTRTGSLVTVLNSRAPTYAAQRLTVQDLFAEQKACARVGFVSESGLTRKAADLALIDAPGDLRIPPHLHRD